MEKKQTNFFQFHNIPADSVSTGMFVVVLLIIFFLLVFSGKSYLEQRTKTESLQQEISALKNRADIINNSKKVAEDQIDEYINILSTLIPNTEDYFSLIYTLEKLSHDTGFIITNYTVNVSQKTSGKLSLTVEGHGDANSFIDFLKNYQFSGGRLITSEKIEFSSKENVGTKVALNFYNKKADNLQTIPPQLTMNDVKILTEIRSKISYNFMPEVPVVENYPRKTNPF
jgi:Tfp pilus assembly protein PilO